MVDGIVLTNLATGKVLELNKVTTLHYILDNVDWGQVGSTHHSFKYVNQVGVYVTGTSLETRDINVMGWIVAKSENQMNERKRMLNAFVNPQQLMRIEYKDYILDFLPDSSIKYSAVVVENNDVVCKFAIVGLAPDPLFKNKSENQVIAASTRGLFHFPLVINRVDNLGFPTIMFGLREPSLIIDVFNGGAVSTGMKMVFKAKGTLRGPSLINVKTQEYFRVNKQMVPGETITIETTVGEKKIVGSIDGVDYNYFKYRDFDSTWLQLEVGDNLFRYNADENIDGLEVYVYYYDRFLEVQECD